MNYGLYIHIPYCKSRCAYCDFYSQGGFGEVPLQYVQALVRSFNVHAPKDAQGRIIGPQTVYFGGGTPSLLKAGQVEAILQAVQPQIGAEITLEVNPENVDYAYFVDLQKCGVNRISVGVQSGCEQSLRTLGRRHTAQQAVQALRDAQKAGFSNISGDIMIALPNYSNGEFDKTLKLLGDEGAVHISAYLLKLEEHTPMGMAPPVGMPNADATADFYLYAVQQLRWQGFAQYEISNFAKAGYQSRHNLLYWRLGSWLGLGPGAHSCMGGVRFAFEPLVEQFEQGVPPKLHGEVTAQDYIMMGLRLAEGFSEEELKCRFGAQLTQNQKEILHSLCGVGYASKTEDGWALTKEGMLMQNAILVRLFG